MRFDRWAKKHFPALGFVDLQRLLRSGQFRLDGKRVAASDRIARGQSVRVPPLADAPPPRAKPPVGARDARFIRSLVLHEDDAVIVLDKPAGLAVQGGTGTERHVDGMLGAFGEGEGRPRLVHRLDKDTSGLLVLARTAPVARALMHAFQGHEVRKLYWAIVQGRPDRSEGVVDLRLGKAGPPGRERMGPEALDAKRARTGFRVIARAGGVAAWVGLLPLTGRTHQLRAHCAAVGTPILGDAKYGASREGVDQLPQGLMLHARAIDLPHPTRKGRLRVEAEPPKAFKEALAFLGMPVENLPFSRLDDWPDEL
ncbi:MAG: RluA family pseudouridine synthase [Geminicoccaceae bacterium]|nr:RluA family pseudouridine synthase [Geminicoccaceae bacterium]